MNMLASICSKCKVAIKVSQGLWSDPNAHICIKCVTDEFALLTEEEEVLINEELAELGWEDAPSLSGPSCTCGAQRAGSPWHSTWCDLYTPPMGVGGS